VSSYRFIFPEVTQESFLGGILELPGKVLVEYSIPEDKRGGYFRSLGLKTNQVADQISGLG
jgi:hypothetical protein